YNFVSGLSTANNNLSSGSSINVITAITYRNDASVNFGYGDWGIVNSITVKSSSAATRSSISYNFPAASSGALSDAPTYTTQTVSDGTNSNNWTYSLNRDSSTGLVSDFSVTSPGGLTTKTNLYHNSGDYHDGLVSSTDYKSGSTVL